MSICRGIAGYRGTPRGCFIHNDDGSINATADWWANAYATGAHDLYRGFTHAHADSTHVRECEDDTNAAWHCGNSYYNTYYLSIEVDQSRGASDDLFLKNEQQAFKWVADKFLKWGINPDTSTIMLHREVYATDCPARSMSMHGGNIASCKAYFIDQVRKYMEGKVGQIKEERMQCFFTTSDDPDYGNGLYYFDGFGVKGLGNPDQKEVLNWIHRENYGKDIPQFNWNVRSPWYKRLIEVVNYSYMAQPNITKCKYNGPNQDVSTENLVKKCNKKPKSK